MNLLTIASRAELGYSISSALSRCRDQLDEADMFLGAVESSLKLSSEQSTYHLSSSLMGAMGFFEAALSDVAKTYLVAYPGHLGNKSIDLAALAESGSIVDVVEEKADRHVNDLAYKRFSAYSAGIVELFSKGASITEEVVEAVAEVKATRDVFAHGGGKVNAIYLDKSGKKARESTIGRILPLTYRYVCESLGLLKKYVDEFEAVIPSSVRSHGRTATFRQMWDATVLSKHVPFEDAWILEDESLVRPHDENQESWTWSHSERMLLDFFLGVYSSDYPRREHDLITSLRRWRPGSAERKVMQSWVETPFWF